MGSGMNILGSLDESRAHKRQTYDAIAYLPEPSYTHSTQHLSVFMTISDIEITGNLDLQPDLAVNHTRPDLPSWVPDWFSRETWLHRQLTPPLPRPKWYDRLWEFNGFSRDRSSRVTFSTDSTILKIPGQTLGRITSCSTTMGEEAEPFSGPSELPSFLDAHLKVYIALLNLFTLDNADVWHTGVLRLYYQDAFRDKRVMQSYLAAAEPWITRNSSLMLFDSELSTCLRRPHFAPTV